LFNHRLNRLSIMRSRTARVLKLLFRTLGNEFRALFHVVWDVPRAASLFCCYEIGGTSGTIL